MSKDWDGCFVEIRLYTGQLLQSEIFHRKSDAATCQRSFVSCTMVEHLQVIVVSTGEVLDQTDSLTVRAMARRDSMEA